jgi:hypothetical protein
MSDHHSGQPVGKGLIQGQLDLFGDDPPTCAGSTLPLQHALEEDDVFFYHREGFPAGFRAQVAEVARTGWERILGQWQAMAMGCKDHATSAMFMHAMAALGGCSTGLGPAQDQRLRLACLQALGCFITSPGTAVRAASVVGLSTLGEDRALGLAKTSLSVAQKDLARRRLLGPKVAELKSREASRHITVEAAALNPGP